MDTAAKLQFLDQIALFHGLSQEALRRIAAAMKFRQYYRGEVIFWQGKPSDTLYLLVAGIAAVNRSLPGHADPRTVAYVMPGSPFGEVGILESQPRSASVAALTDVDVLVLRREAFLEVLGEHASVAIELARSLGRALVEANRRQLQSTRKIRVILLVNACPRCGQTHLGHALATSLAHKTGRPTAYTEYPSPQKLRDDFGLAADVGTHRHPAGYEIFVARETPSEAGPARAQLLFDHLLSGHDNIVIGLPDIDGDTVTPLFEHANQIVIVTAPHGSAAAVERVYDHLRRYTRADRTGICVVVNRPQSDDSEFAGSYDFTLPFIDTLPPLERSGTASCGLAGPFAELADVLVDRLDRTHQISVYIPTTIDTDQSADTRRFVDETLAFLGRHFGGATSLPAHGVWNSKQVGLISEDVYIVRTYATQEDMNEHLDRVVEYTKTLKQTLRQEAMALEVDRKLVLI